MYIAFGRTADTGPYCSASHFWALKPGTWGKWNVVGTEQFTTIGVAVVDDFGNLVQVPA